MKYTIKKLRINPHLAEISANWFHEKWGIPLSAYTESIEQCIKAENFVPQWYIVLDGEKIVGGAGVIENDFHNRKDLTPNICAVYVEKEYRNQGIAGHLLDFICDDFYNHGFDTLYLLTNHDSFYEKYGWQFLCMAQGDGEDILSRMYIHKL